MAAERVPHWTPLQPEVCPDMLSRAEGCGIGSEQLEHCIFKHQLNIPCTVWTCTSVLNFPRGMFCAKFGTFWKPFSTNYMAHFDIPMSDLRLNIPWIFIDVAQNGHHSNAPSMLITMVQIPQPHISFLPQDTYQSANCMHSLAPRPSTTPAVFDCLQYFCIL